MIFSVVIFVFSTLTLSPRPPLPRKVGVMTPPQLLWERRPWSQQYGTVSFWRGPLQLILLQASHLLNPALLQPVGKTIRWNQKWMTPFLMGTTSSITMQSLGKIVQRAPAVGAKTWCLFFVVGHAPSPLLTYLPCVRGVHSSNKHCVAVYCRISTRFAAFFFDRDCSFRSTT